MLGAGAILVNPMPTRRALRRANGPVAEPWSPSAAGRGVSTRSQGRTAGVSIVIPRARQAR